MNAKVLIRVNSENRNAYFRMIQENPSIFRTEFGRIGATPYVTRHPMSLWDDTYQKKIKQGYTDKTDDEAIINEKKEYLPISDTEISDFVDFITSCASCMIKEQYSVKIAEVTKHMITDAQSIIYELSVGNFNLTDIQEKAVELFSVIPRKMKSVSDHLPQDMKDVPLFLKREQDMLDVVTASYTQNIKKYKEKQTILQANDLDITVVTDATEINQIKKNLTKESRCYFKRAFRVRNRNTDKMFREYCERNNIGKSQLHYYYHGSRNMNYWGLITQGPKLNPKAPITGKMFGQGLYYANRAKKSINYTDLDGSYWAKGNQNKAFLAVYKVAYKNPLHLTTWEHSCTSFNKNVIFPHDAVYAHKGSHLINDEIIIYDENQVTLQYIIELHTIKKYREE